MAHRLYMDVHVPAAITEGLRRRSVDVLTAQEDGASRMDDDLLLDRAMQLGRVVFTQDEDFLAIAAERQRNSQRFTGVIYAHQQNAGIGVLVQDLELVAQCATDDEVHNRVVYLPL